MKRNLLTIVLAAATIFITANANAQQFSAGVYIGGRSQIINRPVLQQQAFYYYPSANVYFNIAAGEYAYQRRSGVWVTGYRLPERFRISNAQRFTVYHNGMDVWAENRVHVMNFQRYGRPEIAYHSYNQRQDLDNCQR